MEELKGTKGVLALDIVEVNSFELTDHLIFTGMTDLGKVLSQEQCMRMMELPAQSEESNGLLTRQNVLEKLRKHIIEGLKVELKNKDFNFLQQEIGKLNKWADDRIFIAEKELRDIKQRIRELTRLATQVTEPMEQLTMQKKIQEMERKQRKQRQLIFDAEDQILDQRDKMIAEIEKRMMRNMKQKNIFTIRWKII